MNSQFGLLIGGSRTALPRQQTLRATIDWSYNLLADTERAILCQLATFAGGWTLEAAESICVTEGETLDVLDSLMLVSPFFYGYVLLRAG